MRHPDGEISQTLDRGLRLLAVLGDHTDGLTASELAVELSTGRAVVYRLVRTFETHNLVARIDNRYVLGVGIAQLASKLRPRLQATAQPILRRLARQTNCTAVLCVSDRDQGLILLTEEPPESSFHVALREGSHHPLDAEANGIAILAGRPAAAQDLPMVRRARLQGYAITQEALQPGTCSIAAPILDSDWATASIGIVQLGTELTDPGVPDLVMAATEEIARQIRAASFPHRRQRRH